MEAPRDGACGCAERAMMGRGTTTTTLGELGGRQHCWLRPPRHQTTQTFTIHEVCSDNNNNNNNNSNTHTCAGVCVCVLHIHPNFLLLFCFCEKLSVRARTGPSSFLARESEDPSPLLRLSLHPSTNTGVVGGLTPHSLYLTSSLAQPPSR